VPISGWLPTAASPDTVLDTARPVTINNTTERLATALATKIRRGERTATSRWRQVPRRSSDAKTSPGTAHATSGSAQPPAKPSMTSDPAHPDSCIHRPKSVSAGSELCWPTATTNTAGAIQHTKASTRMRQRDSSLVSSKR
jgi:hypothetical protein